MLGAFGLRQSALPIVICLSLAGCVGADGSPSSDGNPAGASERAASETTTTAQANELRFRPSALPLPRQSFLTRFLELICTRRDHSYNCACAGFFNPNHVDCSGGGGGGGTNECALGTDNCSANATC